MGVPPPPPPPGHNIHVQIPPVHNLYIKEYCNNQRLNAGIAMKKFQDKQKDEPFSAQSAAVPSLLSSFHGVLSP